LVFQHQCNVPFETLDMHHCKKPPELSIDAVFDKIVTRKRGGYCFELNLLFETLLRSVGFDAYPVFGRFIRGRKVQPPINHQSTLVTLGDNLYVADAGIGGPLAAGALLLADGEKQTVQGEHFTTRSINNTWWAIDRQTEGNADRYGDEGTVRVHTEVELCTAPVEAQDFNSLNLFYSQPGSLFRETNICNLRTPAGYHGLRDKILTVSKDGRKVRRELVTKKEFDSAIEVYFGFRP